MLYGKGNTVLATVWANVLKIRHHSSFWVNGGCLSAKYDCHIETTQLGTERAARLMRFRACLYYLTTLTHIP